MWKTAIALLITIIVIPVLAFTLDEPLTDFQEGILLYERERRRRVACEAETPKRYFAPAFHRLRDAFLRHVHRKRLLYGITIEE